MDGSAAQSIYRLEKERAMQERRLSHSALMAEAKEAFNKLLADAQLARKGGRPRTNPLPPGAANRPPVKPPVRRPQPRPRPCRPRWSRRQRRPLRRIAPRTVASPKPRAR